MKVLRVLDRAFLAAAEHGLPALLAAHGFVMLPPWPIHDTAQDDPVRQDDAPVQDGLGARDDGQEMPQCGPDMVALENMGAPGPSRGPFPGHPERLCPDRPPSPAEAALWDQLRRD